MGFLYHAIIPTTFFINIYTTARLFFITALSHLGLYKPSPEDETSTYSSDNSNNYILILDTSSPSLVPIHVHVVTSAIKLKVPVVKYQDLVLQKEGSCSSGCSICLDVVELEDDVRDLRCNNGNSGCGHVFHKGCLDSWIDEGQITCPLCRSMLLSPKDILRYRSSCKFV